MKNSLLILILFASIQSALNVVDLAGTWEALPGRYDDTLFSEADSSAWVKAPVPGSWAEIEGIGRNADGTPADLKAVPCVWYRTRFRLPREVLERQAVLRLLGARWEVAVYLNGKKAGQALSGYGALELPCASFLRPRGENLLVIRTGGWNSMPQSANGLPLFPTGSGPHWGPRHGALQRGVELHFVNGMRMNKIKLDPKPFDSRVVVRAELFNLARFHGRQKLEAEIIEKQSGRMAGKGSLEIPYHESLRNKSEGVWSALSVKVPGCRFWSPEDPFLYTARIRLFIEGEAADSARIDFGMREFACRNRGFELNRRPIALRGGNLYGHDLWLGRNWAARNDPEKIKRFLSEGTRRYHFNCARTHTRPLLESWNRVADETGFLLISELTFIVNGSGWILSPSEREELRRNLLTEYGRILPEIWNHPSTVMWSMTNESFWPDEREWREWEMGPLTDWFTGSDSTRPLMRAANPSRDLDDYHVFDGWWHGAEGDFTDCVAEIARKSRDRGRTAGISEFMQFSRYTVARWLGPSVIPDPDNDSKWREPPEARTFHAQTALEFVESMREQEIPLILPYLFPDNGAMSDEGPREPPPVFDALKNAYAPVHASLDLFNRHYRPGQRMRVPVKLHCDGARSGRARVSLYFTTEDPGFNAEAFPAAALPPLARAILPFSGPAPKGSLLDVTLPSKSQPGYLVLLTGVEGGDLSLSRREVRLFPARSLESFRNAASWGCDPLLSGWLSERGVRGLAADGLEQGALPPLLVIGPGALSGTPLPDKALSRLSDHVKSGGRLLILAQTRWLHPEWIDLRIERMPKNGAGAVFFEKAMPASITKDLSEADFRRFNGRPGNVVTHRIVSVADPGFRTWMKAQDGWKELWEATALGLSVKDSGRILFCQIDLTDRLQTENPERFDPLADRFMSGLLKYLSD